MPDQDSPAFSRPVVPLAPGLAEQVWGKRPEPALHYASVEFPKNDLSRGLQPARRFDSSERRGASETTRAEAAHKVVLALSY